MTTRLIHGDCRTVLPTLPSESVQCVVTSPPFWGLRDYNVDGQLGLEPTVQEYVEVMVDVFEQVRRVLRKDGTLWLNLGDTYCCSGGSHRGHNISHRKTHAEPLPKKQPNRRLISGLKHKDLAGVPWRIAFALQDVGWYLRSEIIWHKPNALPEGVADRPHRDHEQLFLLSKSATYYYDADSVRTPTTGNAHSRGNGPRHHPKTADPGLGIRANTSFPTGTIVSDRHLRTVWSINVCSSNHEKHFARFPEGLVVPCILAGSRLGDTVLDPFAGSGTVGRVAEQLGRSSILIDLNPDYVRIAERTTAQQGLQFGGRR